MNAYVSILLGAAVYGLYSSLLPFATKMVSPIILVAITSTISAVIAWSFAFYSNKAETLSELSVSQVAFIASFGVMAFLADYLWNRGFQLGGNYYFISGLIATIAVFAAIFGSIFQRTLPNLQQSFGIAICVIGAWLLYTARND